MTVLAFVESSAYRTELAKQLAAKLLDDVGVDGLMASGPDIVPDLLAALNEDLSGLVRQAVQDSIKAAIARGLVEVPDDEALAAAETAVEGVLSAAGITLTNLLGQFDTNLAGSLDATSEEAVSDSLAAVATNDALLAPILSALSSAAQGVIKAAENAVSTEAVAAYQETATAGQPEDAEPPLFEWQTVEDANVCDDVMENSCQPRHGAQLTYDEWGAFGYPGDPDSPTICAIYARGDFSNCRCVLLPADSDAATAEPVKVADAVAAGKARAQDEEAA